VTVAVAIGLATLVLALAGAGAARAEDPLPGFDGYPPSDSAAAARADSAAAAEARALAGTAAVAVSADSFPPAVEFLWVVRGTLIERGGIERLVERAKAMRVRALLVQVVGRGDAWYRSDLLPRPEALPDTTRDPLGELIPLAHAAGLEVHAWMNCCLVWSAPQPPRAPRHVMREHPEWIARMRDGRSMARMTPRERQRLRVEGVFLSPAHPAVRTWIANIAREIATRYDVDGIHLDYIRQPIVPIGYDPTSRAQFALQAGADPLEFGRLPADEHARMDTAWAVFQQTQVTAIVREVRDSLNSVRPGLSLSAAVLADTLAALRHNRQAWCAWLREGLLDRAFPMCYAPPIPTVLGQLTVMSEQVGTDQLVPGIAVYNTPPSSAAAKIKGARALGFTAIALYSYDYLWERSDRWPRLLGLVNGPHGPLEARP
jgi:uncharacterized lipoprotein YddW (UPF0748 family)